LPLQVTLQLLNFLPLYNYMWATKVCEFFLKKIFNSHF
jgi:hypothetical protein